MVAAELRIVLSFSLIVCATAATLPGQMTSSAVNNDDTVTSQELELDDLSLPPEVITEALFSQVDLIQDQLEQCEEMVRNSLNGDTSVESVDLDEQNNITTTTATNNSLAQDTSQEIAQLAVKHFSKDSDDEDDDDDEHDDDNDDERNDDDDDDDDDVDAIDDDDDDDDDDVDANDNDDDVDDDVEETKDRLDSEETSGEVSLFPAEPQENNDITKRRSKRSVSLEQTMMVTSEEGSKKGHFEDLQNVQVTLRQGRLHVDPAVTRGIGSKDESVEREHHTNEDLLLMSGPATFSLQDDSLGKTHVGGEGRNKILGMAPKHTAKKPSLDSVMKIAKELLGSLKSSNAGERGNVASFDQSHRSSGKTPNVDSVLQLVEHLMGSSKAPRQEKASHINIYDPEIEDIFTLPELSSKLQRQRRKRSVEENLKPERYVPLIGQLVDRLKYLKHSLVVCHALLPPGYAMEIF